MNKIKRNCNLCNKFYEGWGKFYCSRKCKAKDAKIRIRSNNYWAIHKWIERHFFIFLSGGWKENLSTNKEFEEEQRLEKQEREFKLLDEN